MASLIILQIVYQRDILPGFTALAVGRSVAILDRFRAALRRRVRGLR